MDQDNKMFIKEQLSSHNIFFVEKQNDFALYCPFYPHERNKLLLQVRFDGMAIHCWGCGAGGTYNTLALKLGLKRLERSDLNGYSAVAQQLRDVTLEAGVPSLPKGIERYTDEYRGLSPKFLAEFSSHRWYDPQSCGYRILWPITYNDRLQGYTAGRLDPLMTPKYTHGPPNTIQTRRCLFGIDHPIVRNTVVLVEGPFSALRLISEGIPAVAVLGAANWHNAKLTMLRQRRTPVRGIVIAFDPDASGERGADTVERAASPILERVERFDCPIRIKKIPDPQDPTKMLPVYERDPKTHKLLRDQDGNPIRATEKCDPGDMPPKYVERLRELVSSVSCSLR